MKIKNKVTITGKGGEAFFEIQSKGVEEFGGNWITLNEVTVNVARQFGIEPSLPAVKEFLVKLTLEHARAYRNIVKTK